MLNNSAVLHHLTQGMALHQPYKVNAYSFFMTLAQNRLLFWFISQYKDRYTGLVKEFMDAGHQIGLRLFTENEKTLDSISSIHKSSGLEYILAKGGRDFPYLNCDVDLLVKSNDYALWLDQFRRNDFSIEKHKTFMREHDDQNIIRKPGHRKVDITVNFDWQDGSYFDADFLWAGYDAKTNQQNDEADLMVNIGSVLFKRMSLNLIDYLYFKDRFHILKNNQTIRTQIEKYCWNKSFDHFLRFMDAVNPNRHSFPVLLPPMLVKTIFSEKLAHRSVSLNYWTYFVLARARYYLLNKMYLPFHVFWIPLKDFYALKNIDIVIDS